MAERNQAGSDAPASDLSIAGKRIIVTGGASGIGKAVVERYAEEGARVASLDVLHTDTQEQAGGVFRLHCDVSDRASVDAAFAAATDALGGLDVLVNVAGVERGGPSDEIPDDQWDFLFDVNVKGTRNTNQAAFRYLRDHGGRIINFGSRSGIVGVPEQAAYSAAKGAVHAWTRAVAQEWASYGVTVNAIAPAMWTGMYDAFRERLGANELAAHDAVMAATIPIGGRLGDPKADLAPVLVFLASDASHFFTGQMVPIDGGWLLTR